MIFPYVSIVALGTRNEGNGPKALFKLERSGNTSLPLEVSYKLFGTAISGIDYQDPTSGSLIFAAGSKSAILALTLLPDGLVNTERSMIVEISKSNQYLTKPQSIKATTKLIPSISLALSSAVVTEDGMANLIYTFTRTGPNNKALRVNYNILGTALPADYSGAPQDKYKTITFAAGSSVATLEIDPKADFTVEPDETIAITLLDGSGYFVNTLIPITGTILNDDISYQSGENPIVTLNSSSGSVLEDDANQLIFTFTRTGLINQPLTVKYSISGSASGSDYAGVTPGTSKTISFAAGSSTSAISISPTEDNIIEGDESVVVSLLPGLGYVIGTTHDSVGIISDDDSITYNPALVTLSSSHSVLAEDALEGLVYTFSRTGPTDKELNVKYSIYGTAGRFDYTGNTPGASKTVNFDKGSSTATFTIYPTNDSEIESDETIVVKIDEGPDYKIEPSDGVISKIINDDIIPAVSLEVLKKHISEDGLENLEFIFTRTGEINDELNVKYSMGGSAGAADFTGVDPGNNKTLIFRAGSAKATILINPIADQINEKDESVIVTLLEGYNYSISGSNYVTGIISNDDFSLVNTVTLLPGQSSLVLTGTSAINGTGNSGNNRITGNSSDNVIDGGIGADTMIGGQGDDVYYVDNLADNIVEFSRSGTDTVNSSISYVLTSNLENLTLLGSSDLNATGDHLSNIIVGNTGNNVIDGGGGADLLTGLAGQDTFRFAAKPSFTALGAAHIEDFRPDYDRLQISKNALSANSRVSSDLKSVASMLELNAALSSDTFFVYDSRFGNLYFNENGSEIGFGRGGIFVVLDNRAQLGSQDITLY